MTDDDLDWEGLGKALQARRLQLGFPKRATWAREELGLTNDRTLSDLEHARRTNYDASTLAIVEQHYEWAPGSVRAVLEGGDPVPLRLSRVDAFFDGAAPASLEDAATARLYTLSEGQLAQRIEDLTLQLLTLDEQIQDLTSERARIESRIRSTRTVLSQVAESPTPETLRDPAALAEWLDDDLEPAALDDAGNPPGAPEEE